MAKSCEQPIPGKPSNWGFVRAPLARLVVIGAAAAVLTACGGGWSDGEGPTVKVPSDPEAPNVERAAAFGCHPASAGVDPMPEESPDVGQAEEAPAAAGQMTEEAAQGKRLFDAERWAEAAIVLGRVVNGDTGDDTGNKQLAEYLLAICDYRLKQYRESLALFTAISGRKNHLKFNETLPWLAKLAALGSPYTDSASRSLATGYTFASVQRFDNPQQRDLYSQILHLTGRQLYRAGQYDRAMAMLEKVPPESEYHELARQCIALARGAAR